MANLPSIFYCSRDTYLAALDADKRMTDQAGAITGAMTNQTSKITGAIEKYADRQIAANLAGQAAMTRGFVNSNGEA
jgi:hypothetical protein